jgi:hypothetical protein
MKQFAVNLRLVIPTPKIFSGRFVPVTASLAEARRI